MPRTNLSSQFDATQRAAMKPKIMQRNTFKYQDGAATVYRLHGTDIVRIENGKTVLNSGGWKTITTKERMNCYSGYNVFSDKGIWYVGQWNGARVPYYDGMILPDALNSKKGVAVEKRELKLRTEIKKFVGKCDKLSELPAPSQGDCFYCQMRTNDGKSLGEAIGDKEHVASHVKEGYLHGSLIWNALKWAGYRSPEFIWQSSNRDLKEGKKPDSVKRALKRYLYRQLGLVS